MSFETQCRGRRNVTATLPTDLVSRGTDSFVLFRRWRIIGNSFVEGNWVTNNVVDTSLVVSSKG